VIAGVSSLLLVVVIHWLRELRTTARLVQSAHNLQNLAISMQAHATSTQRLPVGCEVKPDGTANFGWFLSLYPYLEGGSYISYDRIRSFDVGWNDPVTTRWTRRPVSLLLNPMVKEVETTDGWPLIHYAANPDLFYQNSQTLMAGLHDRSNCWLLGEVSDDLVPWAYPFNWREPGSSAGVPQSPFRNPAGSCQFVMADGSVRCLSPTGSDVFFAASRAASQSSSTPSYEPIAPARYRPAERFISVAESSIRVEQVVYSRPDESKEGSSKVEYRIAVAPDGMTVWAHILTGSGWSREQSLDAVRGAVSESSQITHCSLPYLSRQSLDSILNLHRIRVIVADSIELDDETLQSLAKIASLERLYLCQTPDEQVEARIREACRTVQIFWRPRK
jgi:hypothetical protein